MVKHLVMWRLRERKRASAGLENELQIRQTIDAMRSGIGGLKALEIGVNKGAASDSADLVLYSEFDSWEALQAYEMHPLHEALKNLIGPLRTERRVVDYETS
ncbi:MAG: Dabb family protein [Steroidobacteraceae bacterium]|jgi:hypothetical protein